MSACKRLPASYFRMKLNFTLMATWNSKTATECNQSEMPASQTEQVHQVIVWATMSLRIPNCRIFLVAIKEHVSSRMVQHHIRPISICYEFVKFFIQYTYIKLKINLKERWHLMAPHSLELMSKDFSCGVSLNLKFTS